MHFLNHNFKIRFVIIVEKMRIEMSMIYFPLQILGYTDLSLNLKKGQCTHYNEQVLLWDHPRNLSVNILNVEKYQPVIHI